MARLRSRQVLQLGVAPNRIDLLRELNGPLFETAWEKPIDSPYGRVEAHWIDLDSLIEIKSRIDHPRHQDDARILKMVKERQSGGTDSAK